MSARDRVLQEKEQKRLREMQQHEDELQRIRKQNNEMRQDAKKQYLS
jgi:hypothetical protein